MSCKNCTVPNKTQLSEQGLKWLFSEIFMTEVNMGYARYAMEGCDFVIKFKRKNK